MLRLIPALALVVLLAGCPSGSSLPPCSGNNCPCTSEAQCTGVTPRCDVNAGMCVPCLPVKDNCPSGQHCTLTNGSYACGGCQSAADCAAGHDCCGGACVDTSADPHNCGGCSNNCSLPTNAQAACGAGHCGLGPCNPGYLDCNDQPQDGCEIDGTTNGKNCGTCGNACTQGPNQHTACLTGACVSTCDPGWSHCSANPADGCEAHIDVDLAHCGSCKTPCGPLLHAIPACRAGTCQIASCAVGFGDCDGNATTGCEVGLTSDLANCGACGKACGAVPNGTPACQGGVCVVGTCSPGFADCDGLAINGCETDIAGDAHNCGSCGHTCVGSQSMQACQGAACVITACTPGFADCDHRADTGCEVGIGADVKNCGMCANACSVPKNAVPACVNAVCGIAQCNPGFANCNGDVLDGCEVDQLGDPANCGGCGNVCVLANATPACAQGKCAVGLCSMGFADCNKKPEDGCEVSLSTDGNNCGACGKVCGFAHGKAGCLGAQCALLSCDKGWGNCDGNDANGCEKDVTSDPLNCGQCGTKCPQNAPFCVDSACSAASYATVTHGGQYAGNKQVVFLFAPKGTSFQSNADYAAYCTKYGFTQNQNASNNGVYALAGMFNQNAYYCTGYCCYLGSGNVQAPTLTANTFVNSGLPLNTPLQVFDRGCGDVCGGFATSLSTTDTLTVTGPTTYSYNADALGVANYCINKNATFSQDGVVLCQAN